MKFLDLVLSQTLTPTEEAYIHEKCKRWEDFSNTIGRMDKPDVLKVLNYLVRHRPNSKTLGNRAVQRFNTLNKATWSDLVNGDNNGTSNREAS